MWSDDRSDSVLLGAERGASNVWRNTRRCSIRCSILIQMVGACHAIALKDAVFTEQSQGRLLVTEQCTNASRWSKLIGATQNRFQGFDNRRITRGGEYGCTCEDLNAVECAVYMWLSTGAYFDSRLANLYCWFIRMYQVKMDRFCQCLRVWWNKQILSLVLACLL